MQTYFIVLFQFSVSFCLYDLLIHSFKGHCWHSVLFFFQISSVQFNDISTINHMLRLVLTNWIIPVVQQKTAWISLINVAFDVANRKMHFAFVMFLFVFIIQQIVIANQLFEDNFNICFNSCVCVCFFLE